MRNLKKKNMVMPMKSILVQKKNLLISMTLKRLRPALSFILLKDFVLRKDMHIMELNQNCRPKNFFWKRSLAIKLIS